MNYYMDGYLAEKKAAEAEKCKRLRETRYIDGKGLDWGWIAWASFVGFCAVVGLIAALGGL